MDEARAQLARAVAARDEAVAELQGVRNAHDDLRRRFGDVSAELGSARERVAELESEVAAVTAVAERSASEALEAARAEAAALATEHDHDTETQMAALRLRLATAESAIAAAETGRELAEARALAATTGRHAAAVAHAAAATAGACRPGRPDIDTKATQPRVSEALIAPPNGRSPRSRIGSPQTSTPPAKPCEPSSRPIPLPQCQSATAPVARGA